MPHEHRSLLGIRCMGIFYALIITVSAVAIRAEKS